MHSSGFAVFGVLCLVAGVGLYFGQRTRDQLAYDELHLSTDPWTPPSDVPPDTGGEPPVADEDDTGTTAHSRHDQDDDILDAEYTEYFDYEQSPADQDDGTGYDDDELAYQRYQADHRARDIDGDDDEFDDADEDDDVARTSRIPTGDADDHASSDEGASSPDGDGRDSDQHDGDHEDREGSTGRRR
jgi:hypothetical protein